jgi:preprotein translocase subunit YajC
MRTFILSTAYFLGSLTLALADGPAIPAGGVPAGVPTAAGTPPPPGILGMAMPFVMIFGVMYFLMIRPQQKKMKEQMQMLTALKQGDEVVTTSGMLGTVTGITEKVVTLEVDKDVRVKMLKSQVSQVVKGQVKDLA